MYNGCISLVSTYVYVKDKIYLCRRNVIYSLIIDYKVVKIPRHHVTMEACFGEKIRCECVLYIGVYTLSLVLICEWKLLTAWCFDYILQHCI